MLSLSPAIRIFLCAAPADLRKSFDGLSALVRQALGDDPLSGHRFVFRNRKGDRLKIPAWEEDGWCLWYKRLEQGVVRFPAAAGDGPPRVEVRAAALAMLLDGVILEKVQRRPRYRRPATAKRPTALCPEAGCCGLGAAIASPLSRHAAITGH